MIIETDDFKFDDDNVCAETRGALMHSLKGDNVEWGFFADSMDVLCQAITVKDVRPLRLVEAGKEFPFVDAAGRVYRLFLKESDVEFKVKEESKEDSVVPKDPQIHARVTPEVYGRFKAIADENGTSMSLLACVAIEGFVSTYEGVDALNGMKRRRVQKESKDEV